MPEPKLEGKTACVTGASRGLGREFAVSLAAAGARVAVAYHRNETMANETVSMIERGGGKAIPVAIEVQNENSVGSALSRVADWGTSLDILVNCAAVYEDSAVWNMPIERWNAILGVDLTGAFLCIKHAAKHMREKRWGRIVNISSVVAKSPVFGVTNYAAAKAGLEGLTRAAAIDLVGQGVTVNCVSLGYFDRGMMNRLPENIQRAIVDRIPMKRVGLAREAASLVLYLCSEDAAYLTGQVIGVNGGYDF